MGKQLELCQELSELNPLVGNWNYWYDIVLTKIL